MDLTLLLIGACCFAVAYILALVYKHLYGDGSLLETAKNVTVFALKVLITSLSIAILICFIVFILKYVD